MFAIRQFRAECWSIIFVCCDGFMSRQSIPCGTQIEIVVIFKSLSQN